MSLLCVTAAAAADDDGGSVITCGSVITLRHESTQTMLFSQQVQYGTGSGQQVVTGYPGKGYSHAYWLIRPAHYASDDKNRKKSPSCQPGQAIKNGGVIRLQHVNTQGHLHSHLHTSPLTRNQEVSCFVGSDTGDNWIVELLDNKDKSAVWSRENRVRFKHADTGKYLYMHPQARFGHPIPDHIEVCAMQNVAATDRNSVFLTEEGLYRAPSQK